MAGILPSDSWPKNLEVQWRLSAFARALAVPKKSRRLRQLELEASAKTLSDSQRAGHHGASEVFAL